MNSARLSEDVIQYLEEAREHVISSMWLVVEHDDAAACAMRAVVSIDIALSGLRDELRTAKQREAAARGKESGRGRKKNPSGQTTRKGLGDANESTAQAARATGAGTKGTNQAKSDAEEAVTP